MKNCAILFCPKFPFGNCCAFSCVGTTAMAALEKQCTLSVHYDRSTPNEVGELKKDLESNDVERKTKALKRAILLQLNGEALPGVLMTVIR